MQLEISFPGPFTVKPCFPQLPTAARANVQKTLESLAFLHDPPKGRPYNYRQNLIISPKPFKNLGKMNVFIIRSAPSSHVTAGRSMACTWSSPARNWRTSWKR